MRNRRVFGMRGGRLSAQLGWLELGEAKGMEEDPKRMSGTRRNGRGWMTPNDTDRVGKRTLVAFLTLCAGERKGRGGRKPS